ncbi:MAG: tRNA-dihydrouridine synthase family protein [Candidatus Methanoperedens sp.]|nr:tRNA-dihydrouridine synthase family protein [Candidatus Methanoperedens sp.]
MDMKIGKLKLPGNLVLAPMSGITNLPLRLLCKKYGASLVYSEMISSEAVVRENPKSLALGRIVSQERPVGIQLMGSEPEILLRSAVALERIYKPDIIDLNFGCPAQDVVRSGCGCALLNNTGIIREIIELLTGSLDVPVTAKIRILDSPEMTIEVAKTIEKAGAAALTVHGRTQKQGYSGTVNMETIKAIKSSISIPVIANGDIRDEKTASCALEYTQCDGLMIGRAAVGDPYIFHRISHYLKTGELLPRRTFDKRLDDFFEYVQLCRKYDMLTFNDLKLKAQRFLKNRENIKCVRERLNGAVDIDSIIKIMEGAR